MQQNRHELVQFQSTPSVGRATISDGASKTFLSISIHALRGEGDALLTTVLIHRSISIHALRGEGDMVAMRSQSSSQP